MSSTLAEAIRKWRRKPHEITEELCDEVCMLAEVVMHGGLTKITERAYVAECRWAKLKVLPGKQGPDLATLDGKTTFELKRTQWMTAKTHVNVNWRMPERKGKEREALFAGIRKKMRGEGAGMIISIVDRDCKPVQEYFLSRAFLLAFFKRVRLTDKSTNYNFGCMRCMTCGHFHRLQRLHEASKALDDLSDDAWTRLLSRCDATCKQK